MQDRLCAESQSEESWGERREDSFDLRRTVLVLQVTGVWSVHSSLAAKLALFAQRQSLETGFGSDKASLANLKQARVRTDRRPYPRADRLRERR